MRPLQAQIFVYMTLSLTFSLAGTACKSGAKQSKGQATPGLTNTEASDALGGKTPGALVDDQGKEGSAASMAASVIATQEFPVDLNGPILPPSDTKDTALKFCPLKKSMSLVNAVWLTNIAALQYSHYKFAGPEFEKLGFGDLGDGQIFLKDWHILRLKRIKEKSKSEGDTWKDEAGRLATYDKVAQEFKDLFKQDYSDDGRSADVFQDSILRTANNQKIQFISGASSSKIIRDSSTQATYLENSKDNYSIIAFRGTETDQVADIVADLGLIYTPLDGMGKIHSGFSYALKDVETQLLTILKNRSATAPLNLWITGHSLGGAVATLLTAKIMQLHEKGELKNVNLLGTYTVGSPRVGNREFAKAFDTMAQKQAVTVVRFRNHADPVTTVPVGISKIGGYWHVGSLAYFGGDGILYFRDGWTEIETKSDLRSTFQLKPSEHSAVGYWNAIKKSFVANQGTELSDCTLLPQNVPPLPFYEDKSLRSN